MNQAIFNAIASLLLALSVGLSGWAMDRLVQYGEKLAKIEGNRFTNEDGLAVWKAISDLQTQISTNTERIQAVHRRLDRIEDLQDGDMKHGENSEVLPPLGG